MTFPCCDKERTHLIQAGHGTSNTDHHNESVYICESCGQFRVSAMKNGVWIEVRFSLWNPDSLNAAHKPLERARAGNGPDYLACRDGSDLRELRMRVEETIALAQTESEDGFITAYHFKTGAIHRLLAEVRKGGGTTSESAT